MKLERKYIIAAGLGVISIASGAAYLQYQRIMDYKITFRGLKVNKLTNTAGDIDLALNLQNKSSLKYDIVSQEYNVYVNDTLVSTAKNGKTQTIQPNSISPVDVNIKFNPSTAGKSVLNTLLSLKPIILSVDMKLKVKMFGIPVSIPYTYTSSLKDLLSKK